MQRRRAPDHRRALAEHLARRGSVDRAGRWRLQRGNLPDLERVERLYLTLDSDEAGRTASLRLAEALGERATVVTLPGVKDVAELGERPGGRSTFLSVVDSWQMPAAA